jgi:hypothetical protein
MRCIGPTACPCGDILPSGEAALMQAHMSGRGLVLP